MGTTVGSVVSELVRRNPPVGEIILKNGELAPHIVVTLNGHNIIDLETSVTEQDIVAIFPPIAGGTSPLTPLPFALIGGAPRAMKTKRGEGN